MSTRTKLLIPLFFLCGMNIYFNSSAQEFARLNYKRSDSDSPPDQHPNSISLKDAVNEVKKIYKIKIAYREGLLDGKIVPASLINEIKTYDVESGLKLLLTNYQLNYKKTGNNQFSLFEIVSSGNSNGVSATYVIPVTGKVTSSKDGVTLPMATISIKGNPAIATTSDENGNFKLSLPDEYKDKTIILVISSVGYAAREVTITEQMQGLLIQLDEANRNLDEVVVTALGIKRTSKSLTYSVTEVKGEEFTQARENNIANALTGKIAGVNATGLSTGPGGSSRVIIRGNGSISSESQPLYVINGMPIDNSVPGGSSRPNGFGLTEGTDRGDGIAAINPDDIESITVLKGGTAAALYGSRGANGVILITTKKGKAQKGIGVEYNSTLTMENVSVFPDYQYEYGQGDGGVMPTTLQDAQATGRRSFGAKIDGSTNYMAADGKNHPYSAQKDNLKHFYETGTTFTNTIAFSGGTEALVYRLSLSDLNAKSILPSNKYNRKTANLNISAKLSNRLRIESVIQYNLEKGNNRPIAGDALGNPNWTPYEVANTVDVRWLSPGYDANGNEIVWNDAGIVTNSYFIANKFKQTDTKNRFIGQASVSYDVLKNLTVKGIVTRDFYNYNFTSILPTGTQYVPNGEYAGIKSDVSETNGMITGTYKTKFIDKIGLSILAGANSRRFKNNQLNLTGQSYTTPYFYSFSNLSTSSTRPVTSNIATNSIFGSIDIDYKNLLFLTATGRQDWFSTLSPEDNSIFYPSFGASFVLSDAIKLPDVFNLVRLRASWAQVGGGGPTPYAINLTYSSVPSASSVPLQNVTSSSISNAKLKPFTSTTSEIGLNMQLMRSRLNIDLAFYDRKTDDDIVDIGISNTSGYTGVFLNSGELSNKGVEVLITAIPVKAKHFSWTTSYNFAYNKSEVLRLADGISTYPLGNSANGNAYIKANVGRTFGAIYGFRKLRDASGNIVFDINSNLPLQTDNNQELGKGVPPLTMGFGNEFRYKNFSLDILVDGKFGNSIFSVMEVYATRLGLMKSTLEGRENGLLLTGVTKTGDKYSYTVPVASLRPAYYNAQNRYTELFVHDGSFVKLRQVILSYRLPVSKMGFLKNNVQSASIAFVGRNLLTLYKNTDTFDPEQSLTNGAAQGIESIGLPRTRSYGVNLLLKF
ncbi:SusC/RagA family TonB-linked outer membrane protein [Terrimonas pollutisoli]|uniref:SusC/RagA family TonB-linked outer membrane protein n=1 Tax=Terrimonas pollutisoli TaxID=3034147 RepID=UPI0023EB4A3B|nr:SusC/RagA family TonB-linked outer membrane protein [Terrimonas sp. H1YJ31]